MTPPRPVALLAAAVGACDLATGLALVAAPRATLALLGVVPPPAEPAFQRWIGAFVLAVGLAYLYPFLLDRKRLGARLATLFEVTAIVRTAVALVAGGAILAGELDRSWAGVPAFDAAVAAAQVVLLRCREWGRG